MEENKKPENPNAFPIEKMTQYGYGMTLRDYFAAKAMHGIIEKLNFNEVCIEENAEILSMDAYRIADAMLKERSKE